MTADSAAFLVEPIQGEGGIVVPRPAISPNASEFANVTTFS